MRGNVGRVELGSWMGEEAGKECRRGGKAGTAPRAWRARVDLRGGWKREQWEQLACRPVLRDAV